MESCNHLNSSYVVNHPDRPLHFHNPVQGKPDMISAPSPEPAAAAPPFGTVAIAGLGLLGGSLGLALRRLPRPPRVLGLARREESVREAKAAGILDDGGIDPARILPAADLTVICMPVLAARDFVLAHAEAWPRGAVVTDVGSTKQELTAALTPALRERGVHFVGSHPMAGSEQAGLRHARADLYRHATVFLTPEAGTDAGALARIETFWRNLGAKTASIAPDEHDRLVAATSHVLHLLAAAATRAVLRTPRAAEGTAGGFRDFTRIASSSPEMWADIFLDNRRAILGALDDVQAEIGVLRTALEHSDPAAILTFLAAARNEREDWLARWQTTRREP